MNNAVEPRQIDISLILPCYNSSHCLLSTFKEITELLEKTMYTYEIIIVDDKSQDETRTTIKRLEKEMSGDKLRILMHRVNCGRGKTVYDGFRLARGRIVGFIDVDLDNPARYIFPLVVQIDQNNADICTAKRVYLLRIDFYLILRFALSKGYSFLVRKVLNVNLQDTETGCKFFLREKVVPLMHDVQNRGWFWDTEVMVRAFYANLRILEMPTIFVRDSYKSTVQVVPDVFRYLQSLFAFRKKIKRIRENYIYLKTRKFKDGIVVNND